MIFLRLISDMITAIKDHYQEQEMNQSQ